MEVANCNLRSAPLILVVDKMDTKITEGAYGTNVFKKPLKKF